MLHIYDWSLTGSVPHRLRAQVYNRSPTPQTIVPDYVIYPYILLAVCTSFTLFYFCFGSKESELLSVDSLGYKYNVSAKKSQLIYSNSGFCFKGNTVLPH